MVDRLRNSEANSRRIANVKLVSAVLAGLWQHILSKKRYNKQHLIPLEEVKLENLENVGDSKNGWLIKTRTKSFAVYAATEGEKHEWMLHIERCVQDLLNKDLIYRAKLAEQADRHNDMSKLMLQVAESSEKELLEEERNLSLMPSRIPWLDEADPKKQVAKNYREEVEIELRELCNKEVVDKSLLPKCVTAVSKGVLLEDEGDYLRYLAEISSGDARQEVVVKSRAAYGEAFELAKKEMSPAHPIRLGLALNFAAFYYEIDNSPDKACHLAKQSFDDALPGVDTIDDGMKQDSSTILSASS
uniref:PH domain-containing protein n=1 Tax=Ditylenchus dipsaci TaxID=166011 RepID=A0A915DN22_9BILA